MADTEKNVIFRLTTKVEGDGSKELATDIAKADAETQRAQKTIDAFNERLDRTRKAAQAAAVEQAKLAGTLKNTGIEAQASTGKVGTMSDTITKAGTAFGKFVAVDANTKAFLSPLIAQTDKLGAEARATGGDLDFLKQKAKEAGAAASFAPLPNQPVPQGIPSGAAPASESVIPAMTADAKTLAATLLLLGEQGQQVFDQLGTNIAEDQALLKELIATAAQTPQGAEALAADLSDVQVAALGTLEAMGAITAEQKPLVEQAVKLRNAQEGVEGATKKTVASYGSLRAQLRQAKAELDVLVEASNGKITPEIIAAAKKAGELEDRFQDLNATVSAFNPDKKFQALSGIIQNLAGGFTAVQGALALVGIESEGTGKALLKVQSALAVTQGLQALFGGLRDNLKNLRLLFLSSAAGARILAAGELQAGAAAATSGGLMGGLTRALRVAKVAAVEMWVAITGPIGLAVAAVAVFTLTIYALVTAQEVALVSADKLTSALDRVAKARKFDQDRDKAEASLENEARLLETILDLERQRAAIPSNATAEQKALANLVIDEKIANAQRLADRQKATLSEVTLERDIAGARADRLQVEAAIDAAYKKAHATFVETNGLQGKAALTAFEARQELTQKEAEAALNQAVLERNLTDSEVEGVEKLLEKRDELIEQERDATTEINAIRLAAKNKAIQDQIDITKATEKEQQARLQLQGPKAGTIAELQKQQAELSKQLNEQLFIGSPEFFTTAAKYIEVTRAITNAQESIKGVDVFAAGSLNDLNQELAFLKQALQSLPADAANFDEIAAAANDLQRQVDELNERLKPKDGKEETARRLAALAEEERTALAFHELDERSARQRATTAKASEAELKGIEQQFQAERLKLQLDFELQRLAIMQKSGTATVQELTNQKNKIKEIRAELALPPEDIEDKSLEKMVDNIITAADQIAQAGIQAWQAWSDAQARALDAQIANQRAAVDAAAGVADKGNAKVLEEEKKRLQSLLDARKKAAQQSAAIAQAEAAANAIVAISRAAAEGGGFLSAVTIAATLIALTAGIASARSLASSSIPSFFTGGEARWSKMGGYTGQGDVRRPSQAVGPKPYQYEHREFVMDNVVTGKGDNLAEFKRILRDRVDIGAERRAMLSRLGRRNVDQLMPGKMAVVIERSPAEGFDKHADRIVRAIEQQPRTKVVMDAEGLTVMLRGRLQGSGVVNSRR